MNVAAKGLTSASEAPTVVAGRRNCQKSVTTSN